MTQQHCSLLLIYRIIIGGIRCRIIIQNLFILKNDLPLITPNRSLNLFKDSYYTEIIIYLYVIPF